MVTLFSTLVFTSPSSFTIVIKFLVLPDPVYPIDVQETFLEYLLYFFFFFNKKLRQVCILILNIFLLLYILDLEGLCNANQSLLHFPEISENSSRTLDSTISKIPSNIEYAVPERNRPTIAPTSDTAPATNSLQLSSNLYVGEETKRTRKYTLNANLTRKRSTNTDKWISVQKKRARNEGRELKDNDGSVLVQPRSMKRPCDKSCRLKCMTRVNENDRQDLFNKFWALKDHYRQWNYLYNLLTIKRKPNSCKISDEVSATSINSTATSNPNISQGTADSSISNGIESSSKITSDSNDPVNVTKKKRNAVTYSLIINQKSVKVCRTLFLSTFGITDSWLKTILRKSKNGLDISPDKRGKHSNRGNATSQETLASVQEHINSFPRVKSHFLRKRTNREFLEETLTVHKMHELYKLWFEEKYGEQFQRASERLYLDIFNTKFNISFFRPKKDRCNICNNWENAQSLKDKDSALYKKLESRFEEHKIQKDKARSLKDFDKSEFIKNSRSDWKNVAVACFDYEKVLAIPKSETNAFYYKRKIGVCNFTVTDIGRSETVCYVYDDTIAKKGPNEVGSFLLDFMKDRLARGIDTFKFYSDNCGSQNRNRFVFALYVLAALQLPNVEITHTFLECGHTQTEGDAVHANIECRTKHHEIFTPDQWYEIIRNARRSDKTPYVTREVDQKMVFDLKDLVFSPNWVANSRNEKIWCSKVKVVHVSHENPGILRYKQSLDGDFLEVDILKPHPKAQVIDLKNFVLRQAYNSPIKIPAKKYKDVMDLCKTFAIPEKYHDYYNKLECSEAKAGDNSENTTEDDIDLQITEEGEELEKELIEAAKKDQGKRKSLEKKVAAKNKKKGHQNPNVSKEGLSKNKVAHKRKCEANIESQGRDNNEEGANKPNKRKYTRKGSKRTKLSLPSTTMHAES